MKRCLVKFWIIPLVLAGGCVQRTLSVESDPPGALVYLNNREAGRTPMTVDFTWYGNYEVHLRKEGYQTLKTSARIRAPIWQWPPIDLLAELSPVPLRDHRTLRYTLQPHDPTDEPQQLIGRAIELREDLE